MHNRETLPDPRAVTGPQSVIWAVGQLVLVNDQDPRIVFVTCIAELSPSLLAAAASARLRRGLSPTSAPPAAAVFDGVSGVRLPPVPEGAYFLAPFHVSAEGAERLADALHGVLVGEHDGRVESDRRLCPGPLAGAADPYETAHGILNGNSGRLADLHAFVRRGPFRGDTAIPPEAGGPTIVRFP